MAQDAFVDVAYRGLEVGRRLKLRDVGPRTGYVEVRTPMPVGAGLMIRGDDGHSIAAVVIRVHEQVAGADMPPGMRIQIRDVQGEAAAWWRGLVSREDPVIPEPEGAPVALVAAAPPEPEATDASARIPEPEDEPSSEPLQAHDTAVMDLAEVRAAVAAATAPEPGEGAGNGAAPPEADGRNASGRTMVMSAVDIQKITGLALDGDGEASDAGEEGETEAAADREGGTDPAGASVPGSNGDELQGARTRGRRRRRR